MHRRDATADPSLVARARAMPGNLIGYHVDFHGTIHRRDQLIEKVINRGTVAAGLAYGGGLSEARRRGETARRVIAPLGVWDKGLWLVVVFRHVRSRQ